MKPNLLWCSLNCCWQFSISWIFLHLTPEALENVTCNTWINIWPESVTPFGDMYQYLQVSSVTKRASDSLSTHICILSDTTKMNMHILKSTPDCPHLAIINWTEICQHFWKEEICLFIYKLMMEFMEQLRLVLFSGHICFQSLMVRNQWPVQHERAASEQINIHM